MQNQNLKIDNKQIRKVKFQIGIFVILLLSYIFYPYVEWVFNWYDTIKNEYEQKKIEFNNINWELKKVQNIKKKVEFIKSNQKDIIECVNKSSKCNLQLTEEDIILARAYFMFSKFDKLEKMDFNQKQIIDDFYTYIVSKNRWFLKSISFWNIKNMWEYYILDLTLNIVFSNYDKFIEFLNTLENKISKDEIKNLYIIQNVNYNILKSNEEQEVTVNLLLYYYK